ncbi:GMC oxidoreductase [Agrocybe pediades]|nr:GMC oxidoreductase [Agrocybe pediades]
MIGPFLWPSRKPPETKTIFGSEGKDLVTQGGTSANNFYLWSKPPAQDVDAIEKLGNPGWNWAQYQKYSMKVETFHPPAEEQTRAYPHTFNPAYRGTEGPVQMTIPPHAHTIDKLVQAAMVKNGLQVIDDPYGGNVTGTWIASSNIDPKTWTRSYAANVYLAPNIARDNLYVLTDALVSRILLKDVIGSEVKMATGVEFIHNSRKYTVKVRKEVILSAGTVKSPQILEMSGIGRPEVLHKLGIETQVDLPGVGENVQEHVGFDMVYELDPNGGHETLALLADPAYAQKSKELHAQGKGLNRLGLTSVSCFPHSIMGEDEARAHIKQVEAEVQEQCKAGDLPAGLLDQLKHHITALKDEAIPDCEIIIFPGVFSQNMKPDPAKSYITVAPFQNHPLSRGTIHAETMDPFAPPKIDPNYFEYRSDFNIQIQYFKFVRQLCDTEPLKSDIVQELDPGLGCKSDADIEDFIRNNAFGIFHAIGSCSMLPREKQGVVDPTLKVYGTSNLRVADISILPIHIAAHTQATAYMIGEKAADLIKAAAE